MHAHVRTLSMTRWHAYRLPEPGCLTRAKNDLRSQQVTVIFRNASLFDKIQNRRVNQQYLKILCDWRVARFPFLYFCSLSHISIDVLIFFVHFARQRFFLYILWILRLEICMRPARIDPLARARWLTDVLISLYFISFETTTDPGVFSTPGANILHWQPFRMVGDHSFPSCVFRTSNFLFIEEKKKGARLVRR